MHKRHRSSAVISLAWAAALLLMALAGADCSRKQPGQTTPATVATRPGSAGTGPQPARAPGVQVGSEPPSGVDDRDAPDAPRALPRSGHVAGWTKVQPVRVFSAEQAPGAIDDELLTRALPFFTVERLATCQYESDGAVADVVFIEAPPAHALGLFSVLTADPRPLLRPDGSARGRRAGAPQVHTAWQGRVYVEIASRSDAPEMHQRVELLLDRTVFALPSAEPPLLGRIIPQAQRERCRVWYLPSTRALTLIELRRPQNFDPEQMDRVLGLGGQAMLSLAAIDIVPENPHLIWIAEYPTAQAASAAHRRASAAPPELREVIMVTPPRGRYLAGAWTPRLEALQPVLASLLTALPDAESAMTRPANLPTTRSD